MHRGYHSNHHDSLRAAFVTMSTPEEAQAALVGLNDTRLDEADSKPRSHHELSVRPPLF